MEKAEIREWIIAPNSSDEFTSVEEKANFAINSIKLELLARRNEATSTIQVIDEALQISNPLQSEPENEYLKLSVRELGLRSMGANALYKAGIRTVSDVCNKTPEDLRRVYRFGAGAYHELVTELGILGLSLKEPKSKF